ncbi:glycosyltransferase [Algoriphagus chordae]|uniref:Glycosyl transferase family 4 n=1 Tax=Algoriphagus chordae TaxID=237019 RepID=A0A2W7QI41_9BACT|nr:glycosyltransferase [Algoriphagus chordae]PZX47771.1 glycosyl transferase family 4 [Algoriphagus chordae]
MINKKIKILHLIKSLGRGGAEKLIPETALVHDQTRFEFHCIYFYHQKNNIVDELEAAAIQVHLFPSSNLGLFFQVNKVRDFVKAHQIDIIHAHLPWAGIMARIVGDKLEIPIVYTEHNTWDRYNSISYWGNRMTFKRQDIAIAVSNEVALSMQLNSMVDPYQRGGRMKIKVIQNGVNTEVFRKMWDPPRRTSVGCRIRHGGQVPDVDSSLRGGKKADEAILQFDSALIGNSRQNPPFQMGEGGIYSNLKTTLGIPESAKIIGIVAVFRDQKRLWLWIDLALKILRKCPNTHFILVGDGEWRSRLEKQISDSGKSGHFHLVGVQKQVIPYLSILDIYLSTSEFEGLPIAMLEAMSCEVPVVATRAGGIGEVIQHGIQGFLSEIDEYEELVDHCVELINKETLHKSMCLAARERVVQHFSMNRMVEELEEVYESVIARESTRR